MQNVRFSGILLLKKLTVSAAFVDQKPALLTMALPALRKRHNDMLAPLPGEGLGGRLFGLLKNVNTQK